jgi:hypothetical protein
MPEASGDPQEDGGVAPEPEWQIMLRNQLAMMKALLELEPHGELLDQIEVTEAVIAELAKQEE